MILPSLKAVLTIHVCVCNQKAKKSAMQLQQLCRQKPFSKKDVAMNGQHVKAFVPTTKKFGVLSPMIGWGIEFKSEPIW